VRVGFSQKDDKKKGDCGTVYLQIKYLPDGTPDNQQVPEMKDSSPDEEAKKNGLFGQLKIVVKSARGLPDKDGGWGKGVSDPYTVIELPDGQKWETKTIDDNLNPDWNETKVFTVKLTKDVSTLHAANKACESQGDGQRHGNIGRLLWRDHFPAGQVEGSAKHMGCERYSPIERGREESRNGLYTGQVHSRGNSR
jgi:hypothetical protein